jgi:soluble lytic murein transglycosylase-like protein
MRVRKYVCMLLTFAIQTSGTVKQPATQATRVLSTRWAEYYAAVYQVPVDLVLAVIDVESGWNPYAVSEKGAAGLMQLMPQTAMRFSVQNRLRLDENIRGGVAYLALLNRKFGGDLRLVTAAYYVGEVPISRRKLEYSSAEVQRYVKRVAKRYCARRRRSVNLPLVKGRGDEK